MCPALGVTRQGYYAWRRRPPSARDERDLEPARLISEVCEASRRIYGAPKVHIELLRRGVRTSRRRVARLMRDNVNVNPSFTDSTNAIAPIAPTHPRRFRRRQAPFPASRSGARSFVR